MSGTVFVIISQKTIWCNPLDHAGRWQLFQLLLDIDQERVHIIDFAANHIQFQLFEEIPINFYGAAIIVDLLEIGWVNSNLIAHLSLDQSEILLLFRVTILIVMSISIRIELFIRFFSPFCRSSFWINPHWITKALLAPGSPLSFILLRERAEILPSGELHTNCNFEWHLGLNFLFELLGSSYHITLPSCLILISLNSNFLSDLSGKYHARPLS